MRSLLVSSVLVFVAGCSCGKGAPVWQEPDPLFLGGEAATLELAPLVSDDKGELVLTLRSDPEAVAAEIVGTTLTVTPQPGWEASTVIELTATDDCGNVSVVELVVDGGADPATDPGAACGATITYTPVGEPEVVAVAGAFNDWSTETDRLEPRGDGTWAIDLDLPPGAYPYKLVEIDPGLFEDGEAWSCDPAAAFIQCDAGYKEPWDTSWAHRCGAGVGSCNSLLIVESCLVDRLEVQRLDIDRAARAVSLEVAVTSGSGDAEALLTATLDGSPIDGTLADGVFSVQASGLSEGRHQLEVHAVAGDHHADPVVVPFWLDDFAWEDAVMYFAFVDRLYDGDPSNNAPTGATAASGEYQGGDLKGLQAMLPYLDDLGVDVLWLSNLQDNAEGAWAGDCDATYSGYHAYWPDDATAVEEHFGTSDEAHALIAAAHARGMRVVMDWVANHVHETHPYHLDHPEWFNGFASCKDNVDGQLNFDRIPETCWFAPYLPDIDYAQPEPLVQMVDDAVFLAQHYQLDGFRVDAVKHMPHAVAWNLASAVRTELEHGDAGGDERFWLVGETFDGTDRIKAYLGDNQLDGQFDFPLYNALRGAFVHDSVTLPDLMAAASGSRDAFSGSLMSTFLGNHDVIRFITEDAEGWRDVCDGDLLTAQAPVDRWPYESLMLSWTFLFTQPGVPLIYYGDELGIPGYPDPDNRQPLWWHTGDLSGVDSVEAMAGRVDANQATVVRHVAALAAARRAHPALRAGPWTEWWREDDLFAYAKSAGGDHALVILNRSQSDRQLDNGLGFASLPGEGTWEDALTGETFTAAGDFMSVWVPARSSRVLVLR